MVVCGMGWTETMLDYEDNSEGDPKIERRDPLKMVWDSGASKRNLKEFVPTAMRPQRRHPRSAALR